MGPRNRMLALLVLGAVLLGVALCTRRVAPGAADAPDRPRPLQPGSAPLTEPGPLAAPELPVTRSTVLAAEEIPVGVPEASSGRSGSTQERVVRIVGTVLDVEERPVEGLGVRLATRSGSRVVSLAAPRTDASGRYAHELAQDELPPAALVFGIEASVEGERSFRYRHAVARPPWPMQAVEELRLDLREERWSGDGQLPGRVLDSSGRGVEGALASLRSRRRTSGTITDGSGRYALPDPASWTAPVLTAVHSDVGYATLPLAEGAHLERLPDLVLTPLPTISGRVRLEDGTPVPGARLTCAADDSFGLSAVSDEEGRFVLMGQSRLGVDVEACHSRNGTLATFEASPGDDVDVVVRGPFVLVRPRTPDGVVVRGTEIHVLVEGADGGVLEEHDENNYGHDACLFRLPAGTWTSISARAAPFTPAERELLVPAPEGLVEVELELAPEQPARLVLASPVAIESIELCSARSRAVLADELRPQDDGSLWVPPGTYRLRAFPQVESDEYLLREIELPESLVLRAGETRTLALEPRRGGLLRLELSAPGQTEAPPVSSEKDGVWVDLEQPGADSLGLSFHVGRSITNRIPNEGSFLSSEPIPPGSYQLTVGNRSWSAPPRTVTIQAGETCEARLTLAPK